MYSYDTIYDISFNIRLFYFDIHTPSYFYMNALCCTALFATFIEQYTFVWCEYTIYIPFTVYPAVAYSFYYMYLYTDT